MQQLSLPLLSPLQVPWHDHGVSRQPVHCNLLHHHHCAHHLDCDHKNVSAGIMDPDAACLLGLTMARPRIIQLSFVPGNVGTLKDGYIRRVPLPRVPRIQSTSHVACTTIHRNPIHTGYLPIARIPMWSDMIESLSGLGRCIKRYIPPFSPVRLM
jgi:hypothetical protein